MGFDLECSRCEFVWSDESDTAQPPEACPVCGSPLVPRKAGADLHEGPREASDLTRTSEMLTLASLACFLALGLAPLAGGSYTGLLATIIMCVGAAIGIPAFIVAMFANSEAREFGKGSPRRAARALAISSLAFITWALLLAVCLWAGARAHHTPPGGFGG